MSEPRYHRAVVRSLLRAFTRLAGRAQILNNPAAVAPVGEPCAAVLHVSLCLTGTNMGPDDSDTLQEAVMCVNECLQHAWAHAVVAMAEAATGSTVDEHCREAVLDASLAAAEPMPMPLWSIAAGFNALAPAAQIAVLAYARGLSDSWSRPSAALSGEPIGLDDLLSVLQTAPSTLATFHTALESAPRIAETAEHAAAVQRIAVRMGAVAQPEPRAAAGCATT